MAKFGFSCLPAVSIVECARLAKVCEKNEYDAFWVADEIWYRDPWQVMAICSAKTERLKIATGVTHIYLRNPAFIAQSLATIDEISHGRVICGISIGNNVMLQQCGVRATKPMRGLTEAVMVIRSLLRGETVNFQGELFNYSGVSLKVKPVQSSLPIYIGAKSGPRSFEVAGEIGDGAILTDVYSPEWARVAVRGIRKGFDQARRRRDEIEKFEVASWTLLGVHPDGKIAREIVRPIVCFYLPTQFPRQLESYKIDPQIQRDIAVNLSAGRYDEAIKRTTDEIIEKLSIAGTPKEVAERLSSLSKEGINHFVVAPVDNPTLENLGLGSYKVKGALDTLATLQLVREKVMSQVT